MAKGVIGPALRGQNIAQSHTRNNTNRLEEDNINKGQKSLNRKAAIKDTDCATHH